GEDLDRFEDQGRAPAIGSLPHASEPLVEARRGNRRVELEARQGVPGAEIAEGARRQALARSGTALDQHRQVRRGERGDLREDLPHGARASDETPEPGRLARFGAQEREGEGRILRALGRHWNPARGSNSERKRFLLSKIEVRQGGVRGTDLGRGARWEARGTENGQAASSMGSGSGTCALARAP